MKSNKSSQKEVKIFKMPEVLEERMAPLAADTNSNISSGPGGGGNSNSAPPTTGSVSPGTSYGR